MVEQILIHPENRLLGFPGSEFAFATAPFSFSDYRPAVAFGGTPGIPGDGPGAGSAAFSEQTRTTDSAGSPAVSGDNMVFGSPIAGGEAARADIGRVAETPAAPAAGPNVLEPPILTSGGALALQPIPAAASSVAQPAPQASSGPAVEAAPAILPTTPFGAIDFSPVLTPAAVPLLGRIDATGIDVPAIADVQDLLAVTTGPLSDLGDALEIDLGDLAGIDPAAGVTTLVNLVSITDVFELESVADSIAAPIALPVEALLDALGAEPLTLPDDDDGDALPIPISVPPLPIVDPDPLGGLL